jgi:tubulin polyglutamylase TTLL5
MVLQVYAGGTRTLHYRVKSSRPEVYNIVTDVFNNQLSAPKWEELPAGLGLGLTWNLLWTWSKPRINMSHLLIWQRVNHFPDSKQLTRKDLLKKNLQRYTNMGTKAAESFEIMPLTFILPHEYNQFANSFLELESHKDANKEQNIWIMKPVGLSRGRGISLVGDLHSLAYSQSSVIQRYVERPLCLAEYKFDLRLYVLVTSFRPLESFIYSEGFARLSTQPYSTDPADLQNKFIHLTNSSIQKMNTEELRKDNPLNSESAAVGGSKISLLGSHGLWERLTTHGVDIKQLWQSICQLVLKSLIAVDDRIQPQPCCFEVFGYDVLIDSQLRPWLLEVNASPSLARENNLDARVKEAMVRDTILLVDPLPFDRKALAQVLRRRLSSFNAKSRGFIRGDQELERDLEAILGSVRPRSVGEMPKHLGGFERLSPGTAAYAHCLKLKAKLVKPQNS